MVAVEGEQPVVADRHAMGIAPEIPQDGGSAAEGGLGVDDPVSLEERIDESPPRRRVSEVLIAAGQLELVPVVRPSKRLDNFPRKTRLRTFTGRKTPAYWRRAV